MASLERFIDPQMRPLGLNLQTLPSAKLYFYAANSTTPATVYQDKQGAIAHANPVIADANGIFPQIFLDQRLYRISLTDKKNLVQPGYPIDNIGQDTVVVPFGPWVEIQQYDQGEIVTGSDGNWYTSPIDNNLGNDPVDGGGFWEIIPKPVASSFTSNVDWVSFSDDGNQISVDIDTEKVAEKESTRFTLGGTIGAGQVTLERNGNVVTITSVGEITHGNLITAASDPIPTQYRLGGDYIIGTALGLTRLVVSGTIYFCLISVTSTGQILFQYRDLAGALVPKTTPGIGFSISYSITSETL